MDYPKFIVSNLTEESISIQRVIVGVFLAQNENAHLFSTLRQMSFLPIHVGYKDELIQYFQCHSLETILIEAKCDKFIVF